MPHCSIIFFLKIKKKMSQAFSLGKGYFMLHKNNNLIGKTEKKKFDGILSTTEIFTFGHRMHISVNYRFRR